MKLDCISLVISVCQILKLNFENTFISADLEKIVGELKDK